MAVASCGTCPRQRDRGVQGEHVYKRRGGAISGNGRGSERSNSDTSNPSRTAGCENHSRARLARQPACARGLLAGGEVIMFDPGKVELKEEKYNITGFIRAIYAWGDRELDVANVYAPS